MSSDSITIAAVGGLIAKRWPGCIHGTEPGNPAPDVIIGREAQAFIARGPFDEMGVPNGDDSFYFHADAPSELAALLLVFARAEAASAGLPNPAPPPGTEVPRHLRLVGGSELKAAALPPAPPGEVTHPLSGGADG